MVIIIFIEKILAKDFLEYWKLSKITCPVVLLSEIREKIFYFR